MKGKLFTMEKKLKKNKKNKKEKIGYVDLLNNTVEEDTLESLEAGNVEHVKYLLIFKTRSEQLKSDSIFIFYNGEERDVNEAAKARLEVFVNKLDPRRIVEVTVRQVIQRGDAIDESEGIRLHRMRKIRQYLKQCGISPEKVISIRATG